MKSKIFASVFLLLAGNEFVEAQETSNSSKARIFVSDTYVGLGTHTVYSVRGSATELNTLTASSSYQSKVPENGNLSTFNNFGSGALYMAVGLNFRDKDMNDKNNFQLRVGLSYMSGSGSTASWYNETKIATDTLVSSQNGTSYTVDSIKGESYSYSYDYDQMRLDISAIYRTNQASRWSAYAGVGVTFGLSLNANTNVNRMVYSQVEVRNSTLNTPAVEYFESSLDDGEYEVIENKTVTGGSLYSTFGINFRLGKSHPFWSKINLGYEIRPGINVINSPELGVITNTALFNLMTLRVAV